MAFMRLPERQPVFEDCDSCGKKAIVFPTESPWNFDVYCLSKPRNGFRLRVFARKSTISWAYINPAPTYTEPTTEQIEQFWEQWPLCSWCGERHEGGPEKCDDIPF